MEALHPTAPLVNRHQQFNTSVLYSFYRFGQIFNVTTAFPRGKALFWIRTLPKTGYTQQDTLPREPA